MNVNDELRMCKEAVVVYFEVLSKYLHGGTEENNELQLGQPATGPRNKPHTY
jgi:hypothetical protein